MFTEIAIFTFFIPKKLDFLSNMENESRREIHLNKTNRSRFPVDT